MNALCVTLVAWASKASCTASEFTAERYVSAIERFKCTWITSVPTMLAMIFIDPKLTAHLSSVSIGEWPSTRITKTLAHVENISTPA